MIYFLSDAHLGSRAIVPAEEHRQKVLTCLHTIAQDATQVFLLGDIFDFWFEYYWHQRDKEEYRPILDCLRQMTDRGIEVHYFIGNHDIWTFGWLERQTGVILHRQPCTMTLAGKQVYMAHGDGLVPSDYMQQLPEDIQRRIRGFMRLRRLFHHPVAQALCRLLPPSWGNRWGYEWARRSRLKELDHPCPYKGENQEELVLYAKEMERTQHHDYYIFGHRHIELDLMITPQTRVVILGDMFRNWTYAQMDENGQLIINNI